MSKIAIHRNSCYIFLRTILVHDLRRQLANEVETAHGFVQTSTHESLGLPIICKTLFRLLGQTHNKAFLPVNPTIRCFEPRGTKDALSLHKLKHELLCNNSSPRVDGDFHATDFLVDVFHELDNEIDQLMLPQLLQVRVSHEEADVESLSNHARRG